MGRYSSLREFAGNARKRREENNSLDALVKRAQLQELGYETAPRQSRFGPMFGETMDIMRDPNFVGTKSLEREQLELKNNQLRNEIGSFGQPLPAGMVRVDGKAVKDPSYVTPYQQVRVDVANQKKAEAEQAQRDREEILRSSTEDTLETIGEAKKGLKYFGPMGNLPTVAAPSSLFGEYGPRKKWEANVNKLLSQKVIDVMTQMKTASKTGATGFGQLSNKELGVLQDAATALKKDLAPEDAIFYLDEMEKIHSKFLGGGQQRFGQPDQENQQNRVGKYEIVSVE